MQVKITGHCSASDCLGFVRPRNCSKQWTDNLFTIEDSCKTSYRSDDENSKLQSLERSCGKRSSHQQSKKKDAYVERKVGECFQWKTHGQCSKGESCSFSHDKIASGNRKKVRDRKDDRFLMHQIRRQRPTVKNKDEGSDKRSQILCRYKIFQKNPHVNCGIFPYVRITGLKKDAYMATNAIFDMLRQRKSPAKSQRKVVQEDPLLY